MSVLTFAFMELAPGDFLTELQIDPRVPRETVERLRQRYGLDQPLHVRYLAWLASVARGELGYSFSYGTAVGPLLAPRVGRTLLLTSTAMLVSWGLALVLGVAWALQRGRLADRLGGAGTSLLLSTPDLLLALLLLLFAARTRAFPVGGMVSLDHDELSLPGRVADLGRHLFLPVVALVLASLPTLLRHVRAAVAEVLDAPFVLAARAQGLPAWRLLLHHVLPAAANPLISLFGLSVAGLLSGSVIVEYVMSWPGLGPLLLEAIRARDVHLVVVPVMASAALLVVGNLIADLLLYAVDPRIRREGR